GRMLSALPRRDGDPLPTFGDRQAGQVHDLPHVVRRMSQGPVDRLEDRVRLAADDDGPFQVILAEPRPALEQRGPPRLPAGQEARPGIARYDDELAVAVPAGLFAVAGEKVGPPRPQIAGEVFDDEGDAVGEFARLAEEIRVGRDLLKGLLGHFLLLLET